MNMMRYGTILTFLTILTITLTFGLLPQTSTAQVTDSSVILYLPFEEGSGNVAKDLSKTKAEGKLVGNPKWVAGKFGKALEFDGKTNYVEIPVDLSPQAEKEALSICAWVKVLKTATDAHGQNRQPIVMKGGPNEWEYALYVYDDFKAGFSLWQCGGSGHSEPNGGTIPANEWHAVCATYSAKGETVGYVDGKRVFADKGRNATPCNGKRLVRIASREDGQFLNAVVDDVFMWEREVTEKEVQTIMNAPHIEGVAVEPQGKLTTSWGTIKRSL
jgi:hypothetical protein